MSRGVEREWGDTVKEAVADGAALHLRPVTEDVEGVDLEEPAVGRGGGGGVEPFQQGAEEAVVTGIRQSVREEGIGQFAGVTGEGDFGHIFPDVGGEADNGGFFEAGEPFTDTDGEGEPGKNVEGSAKPFTTLAGIGGYAPEFALFSGKEGGDDVRLPVVHDLEHDRFDSDASHSIP
jgi:hypothetical protein